MTPPGGVLLDSHVFLWVMTDDARRGRDARVAITTGPCVVSAASTWELAIKATLGTVSLPGGWAAMVAGSGVAELPIRHEHAWALHPADVLPHPDPFDRMLYAQSVVESLTLSTAGRLLLPVPAPPARIADARL